MRASDLKQENLSFMKRGGIVNVGDKVVVTNIRGKKEKRTFNGIVCGMSVYLDKQGVITEVREDEPPFDCLVEFEDGNRIAFKFSELEPIK